MKKLMLITAIALITITAISCHQQPNKGKAEMALVAPQALSDPNAKRVSLNGFAFSRADSMVTEFQGDPGPYDTQTTIWFSKQYVDELDSLLNAESSTLGTDGVRLYFARYYDGNNKGTNTIVMVSTMNDGIDANRTKSQVHLDYFDHDAAFLTSTIAQNQDEGGKGDYGDELFGSTPCPNDNCTIISKHKVSCSDARNWVANWNSNLDINANSEWFDLGVIDYLKNELDCQGAVTNHADGIRIYYSRRKDNQCVFIWVTTKTLMGADGKPVVGKDGKPIHQDYYTCYNTSSHGLVFVGDKRDNGLADPQDNGELCPVNCTGTTLPSN